MVVGWNWTTLDFMRWLFRRLDFRTRIGLLDGGLVCREEELRALSAVRLSHFSVSRRTYSSSLAGAGVTAACVGGRRSKRDGRGRRGNVGGGAVGVRADVVTVEGLVVVVSGSPPRKPRSIVTYSRLLTVL